MPRKPKETESTEEPLEIWRGKVPITRINQDIEMQVRKTGVDMDYVKDYAKSIEDPMDDLPPIGVFTTAEAYNDNCHLLLADGFHRIEAYKVVKRETVPVVVFRGERDEAYLYGISENIKHGKNLTHKERVHLAKKLIADEKYKEWSVRKMADKVGLSKSTVQNIKNPPEPPKPKTKQTTPEVTAPQATSDSHAKPVVVLPEPFRTVPSPVTPASGPSVTPLTPHERKEPTLVTSEERLKQIKDWVKSGHVDRSDIMNIFAGTDGRLVWVPRNATLGKKTLIIRYGAEVLVESVVDVVADLPAVIEVSVEDPKSVEYRVEEEDLIPI